MSHTAFILATAGHVDHGKSSLVRALTGTDPDRLPEEKARGMTIDLGFAHLLLTSEQASDVQFDIGIVDVPGHEDFVRNMVAGVGSIDAALLVVGADDGWMPQTEEHLQILTYFGVCHGVVALTKADLAIDLVSVERSVRERLRGTLLSDANIIRTSVKDGRGLDDLRRSLSRTFAAMVPPTDVSKPRLAIDRAFSLRGVGTVVTGSLAGGRFRRGDEVILQSSGTRTRIRTLQTHGKDVDEAIPGMRVAINLPDVSPASGSTREDAVVRRGDVVTVPHVGVPVRTIDVLLERSPRAGPDRLRSGAVVRIHVGSCSIPARVRLLDAAELNASQCALARITFRSSVFILTGERFVLRDWSEQHTLAGGVVLDVIPPGKRRREAQLIMLKTRSDSPDSPESFAISQVVRDGVCERKSILRQSVFAEFRIAGGIDAACKAGTLVAAGEIVAESGVWADLLTQARGAVDAFHQSYPERPGIPLTEINRLVTRRVSAESAYDAVIHALTAEGFRRDATVLRRTSHRPALPPRLELAGGRIRVALARRDLDAPTRHQIAPDDLSMQALKFLIANGEAVEIGMDQVLSSDAYAKATSLVRQHIQQHGPSTVSELKSALGSSRRVMVPLIEKLDREGVTRRQGDTRTLR